MTRGAHAFWSMDHRSEGMGVGCGSTACLARPMRIVTVLGLSIAMVMMHAGCGGISCEEGCAHDSCSDDCVAWCEATREQPGCDDAVEVVLECWAEHGCTDGGPCDGVGEEEAVDCEAE